jgi:hypothetical protein
MHVDVIRDVVGDDVIDLMEGSKDYPYQGAIDGAAPEAPSRLRLRAWFQDARFPVSSRMMTRAPGSPGP